MKGKSTTGLSKFLIISLTIYIMYELYVYNKQLETQREEQERQRKEEQKQKEEEQKKNRRKKIIIILLLAITYFFVLFFPIIISKLTNPTTHTYSRTFTNENYDEKNYFITGNENVYYLNKFKVKEITTKKLLLKEAKQNMKAQEEGENRYFIYIIIKKDNKTFTGYVNQRCFENPNNNNVIKIPLITPNFYKNKREFLLLNREEFETRIKNFWNYLYRDNVFHVVKTEKSKTEKSTTEKSKTENYKIYYIYDIENSYYYNPSGYHGTA